MAKRKRKRKGPAKSGRHPRYEQGHLDRGRSENGRAEKLSEALLEFIGPYRQGTETSDDDRKLIDIGALAWNLALLGRQRQEFMREVFAPYIDDPVSREGLEKILAELIECKERYFAHDRRFILDYDLIPKGGAASPHRTFRNVLKSAFSGPQIPKTEHALIGRSFKGYDHAPICHRGRLRRQDHDR